MNKLKNKIDRLEAKIEGFEAELKNMRRQLQIECSHTDVCECEHRSSFYISLPPMRVCRTCGVTEEGWTYYFLGRNIMSNRIDRISRDELYRVRRGYAFKDADSTAYVRGLITEDQILSGWTYDLEKREAYPPKGVEHATN